MPLLHSWKSWSWPAVPVTLRNVEWFKAGKKAIWKGRRRENEWNSPACLYRHRDAIAEKGHLGLRKLPSDHSTPAGTCARAFLCVIRNLHLFYN